MLDFLNRSSILDGQWACDYTLRNLVGNSENSHLSHLPQETGLPKPFWTVPGGYIVDIQFVIHERPLCPQQLGVSLEK